MHCRLTLRSFVWAAAGSIRHPEGTPLACRFADAAPRRYAVHLHLVGQTERVHFPKLEMFQEWYQGIVNAEGQGGFVNVPDQRSRGRVPGGSSGGGDRRARGTSVLLRR